MEKNTIHNFNVRDMLTVTAYFINGNDELWVETLLSVQSPKQENIVLHFLQGNAMAFEAVKARGGDWKGLRVLITASDVRLDDGRKYYEPVSAISYEVEKFFGTALNGQPLPDDKKSISELTVEQMSMLAVGTLFVEEARLAGKVSTDDLRGVVKAGPKSDEVDELARKLMLKKGVQGDA